MKIYPKILLITLPLIVITALLVGYVCHNVAHRAVWKAVQDVLEFPLSRAVGICEREQAAAMKPGGQSLDQAKRRAAEAVASIRFKETGHVFVVSGRGMVLAHPQDQMQGLHVGSRGWFKDMIVKGSGQSSFVLEGETHWAVFSRFDSWGWYLVSTALSDELTGPLNQLGSYILIMASLSLVLASLPLFILARRLVAPINTLIAGTDRIRRGDLGTHIPITTEDEIGVLAGASNAMTAKLRELICSLEERNRQLAEEVAERLRTEEALRRSEEKYRSIFDNAVEGIFQSTPQGRYLSVNPSFARMFGYTSPRELMESITDIGRQVYLDPEDREAFLAGLEEKDVVSGFTTRVRHKDGGTFWISESARVIRGAQGEWKTLEGFCVDISAQKEAEEATLQLEEQLRQSQKMEALGNLTGGIAHDFNNLLQAMSGYVQLLLLKKDPSDPDYKYLAEVDRTAERARDLVRRLLTFSRKMEVHPQQLDLNRVIEETLQMLGRTIPKMVSIETSLAADLHTIQADPLQLEQVLVNLTTNAVDVMAEGGTLAFETANFTVDPDYRNKYLELASGEYVLLSITDTGEGMDAETLERIFEPFFTTKEAGRGTGLGLSMVYGIVKGHGGHITCYSEPGKGTTFRIYLPVLARVCLQEAPLLDSAIEPECGSETLLLVDDEDIIREIGRDVLTQKGYTVLCAASGEEAVRVFVDRARDVELIILDLGMPGMGGAKCLETLLELAPGVKVIVASGYGAHKIARDPERYGAAGFLTKPYRLDELLIRIREVLDSGC